MIELAVDTETTGTDSFHGCKPFMVTACDGSNNYVWTGEVNPYDRAMISWDPKDKKEIQELLDDVDVLLFHNAKFDVRMLSTIGIYCEYWPKIHDTMLASHVCCSGERHALKQLAFKYLGYYNKGQQELKKAVVRERQAHPEYDLAREGHYTMPGTGGAGTKWYTMDYWLCMEECTRYGCDDVEMTWLLWQMYKEVIEDKDLEEVYENRRKLLEITYDMQTYGMSLYEGEVNQQIRRQKAVRETLTEGILQECKINNRLDFNNEEHLKFFLFTVLGLEVTERSEKTGKPLMNKDVIADYIADNPDCIPLQHFADYKRAGTKIGYLSSYLKWADLSPPTKESPAPSRVHSNLLITGTRETRQASRDPNTQNIDKELTGIFGPPEGYVWLIYDLVNIELRIWGYEVGNKEMVEIFDQKRSFHMEIARTLYPTIVRRCEEQGESFKEKYGKTLYGWVKNGNFSVIYGGGERKANNTYKATQGYTLAMGHAPKHSINAYRAIVRRFPEVPIFTQKKIDEVFENDAKYNSPFITCKGGYPLDVPINEVYTKACNYFCQGSAGYIIGLAMDEVHNNPYYRSSGARMVNQVHDSLYIEVPIEENTPALQLSLQRSIEAGGERLLPTCEAELEKIIYHPSEAPLKEA